MIPLYGRGGEALNEANLRRGYIVETGEGK